MGQRTTHATKGEIAQVVYKTACAIAPNEIADDLDMPVRQVKTIIKNNKYEIQKRASDLVETCLETAVEVTKNNIAAAHKISLKDPDNMSNNEMRFQEKQGIPAVKMVMETSGILGAEGSQSIVTQNLHQVNNVILTPAVVNLLKSLSSKLEEE